MSEGNFCLNHDRAAPQAHRGAAPGSCSNLAWPDQQPKGKVCRAVVRLIVELGRIADRPLPAGRRISLLRELESKVTSVSSRIPEPVVSSRRFGSEQAVGQTCEQRLGLLMIKNLKVALDDLDRSEVAYSRTSAGMRSWLLKRLYRIVGQQIEYAVRWDRTYPPGVWETLHELYFYLRSREDIRGALNAGASGKPFDPEIEYKRLLLFGLVGQLVPAADRSPLLYEALESLAGYSKLEHPASYGGAFDMFVVEIAQDKPPHVSGVLDHGLNGWVLEPGREFLDLVGAAGYSPGSFLLSNRRSGGDES